jgi:hypothetical protein
MNIIKNIVTDNLTNENVYVAFQLEKLNLNFNKVIHLYNKCTSHIDDNKPIIDKLFDTYKSLVEHNKRKDLLFCLDSFFFQCKIFKHEFDNLNNFRLLYSNRLYCDYYKLYQLILDDLSTYHLLNKDDYTIHKYENYKDLDPLLQYSIDDIEKLNNDIIDILSKLCVKYTNTSKYISQYNKKNQVGPSISNFLNTLNYENNNLLEKITLYKNFIAFFDQSHITKFEKLIADFEIYITNLNDNINTDKYLTINDLDEDVLLLDQDIPTHTTPFRKTTDLSMNDILHQNETPQEKKKEENGNKKIEEKEKEK